MKLVRGLIERLAMALVGSAPRAPATPSAPLAVDQAASDQGNLFEALIKEYELTFNALEQSVGRNVQITIAIVTTLGAALSVIPQIRLHEHFVVVLVLPAFFVVLFGILLFELSTSHAHIWSCRALTQRINTMLPNPALLRFEPSFPTASAFSVTRGLRKVQILQAIMLAGPFVLLFGLLAVLARGLFDCAAIPALPRGDDPGGTCPGEVPYLFLLWVPTVLIEMLLALGPMTDIPGRFRAFFGDDPEITAFPARTAIVRKLRAGPSLPERLRAGLRTPFFWFMPRPWDFVCKWPVFWIGFMTIWIAEGLSPRQVDRVNQFVGPLLGGGDWTISTVPTGAVLTLALIYFLIEEVGFQQAKFLIDDAQPGDVKRDETLLQNRGWRAVSAGIINPDRALTYGLYRGAASLAFAYVIGGEPFLFALVLSAVHQAVYVFLLKPIARSVPVLILFWISLNLVPRLLAGFVAASDQAWSSWVAVVVVATFIVSSLGGMAAQWKMEAQHHGPGVRGQSAYLLAHGDRWQTIGFAAAIGLPLVAGLIHIGRTTSMGYGTLHCLTEADCPPFGIASSAAHVVEPGVLLAPAALACSLIALILAALVTWPRKARSKLPNRSLEQRRGSRLPAPVVGILTLALAAIAAQVGSTLTEITFAAWFGSLLVIPIAFLMRPSRSAERPQRSDPSTAHSSKPMVLGVLFTLGLGLWTAAAMLGNLALWFAMLTALQAFLFVHFSGMKYTEFAVGGLAAKAGAS